MASVTALNSPLRACKVVGQTGLAHTGGDSRRLQSELRHLTLAHQRDGTR